MTGGGASERRAAATASESTMTTTKPTSTDGEAPPRPPQPPPPPPRHPPPRSDALSYATFYIAGLAVLAPWNALITCSDVWEGYFPGKNIPRLLTACYLPVTLLLMFVLLLLSHEKTFPRARAVGGLAAFAVLVAAVPAWDAIAAAKGAGGTITAAALLTLAVLVGVVDGLAQPAVYGEAALLPSKFTQAVCAGTAASGALTSLIRILTKVAFDNNNKSSAAAGGTKALVAFFGASAVECAAAAVLFACVLPKTRAARSLAAGHAEVRASLLKSKEEVEMAVAPPLSSSTAATAAATTTAATKNEDDDDEEDTSTDSTATTEARGLAAASRHPPPSRKRVARHMWPCAAAMVVIYGVTIALFPAAFSDLEDKSGWFFIGVAALFNLCDLIGKTLPAFKIIAKKGVPRPKMILFYSCCRVVFIPALIFSAKAGGGSTAAAAGLVSVVSALLGLTNGFLTVSAFMTASDGLHGRDAEDAGTATVFALVAGLVAGSAASFLFLLK